MVLQPEMIAQCMDVARRFHATKLILFGSALTKPESARDIDLACEGVVGWDLFKMGAELEEVVSYPVDLVPLEECRFPQYIRTNGRVLYEAA